MSAGVARGVRPTTFAGLTGCRVAANGPYSLDWICRMLLQGLFVPLTCPFYRDGGSYLRKMEHNVRRYSLGPASGLVALPPEGEASGLTDAEAHDLLKAVAETAGKEKVLVAGVERSSVRAAVELAEVAATSGFDAVLLSPPANWARLTHGADGREVPLYYQAIADASPLPVVLWNDPSIAALRLPLDVLVELAHTPNIIGLIDGALTVEVLGALREATADVKREVATTTVFEAVTQRMLTASMAPVLAPQTLVTIGAPAGGTAVELPTVPTGPTLKTRTRTVGFQILSAGPAHDMLPLLIGGAAGVMPPLAACAPQGCHEVYAAWKDGDERLSAERAQRLAAADELMDKLGPAGIKYGCDWNGYYGGQPRLPRVSLTAEQRTAVERALGEVRN